MSRSFLVTSRTYVFLQFGTQASSTVLFLGGLLPEMMESEMPPPVSSPNKADDFEVSSRRVSPDPQVMRGVTKTRTKDDTLVAQGAGTGNKGPGLSGFQLETILGANEWFPLKGGHAATAASGDPEAPDILTNMLRQASVFEDHRTLMGTVVKKVLSAKSVLNEAFTSLIRGFEVCAVMLSIVFYSQNTPMYR